LQQFELMYGDYLITTDKTKMSVPSIHKWLAEESYWCKNVPMHIVRQSFDHSYCVGALHNGQQIGFARLITDYSTFGYLADVYVIKEHRGKGVSKAMLELLLNIDWVKNLRGIRLMTSDAHELYAQFGFTGPKHPDKMMEISRPNIYEQSSQNE
jgi:GNAT superfamily N-acetyltransferase